MSRTIARQHSLPYLHPRCPPEADLMDPVSMKEGRRPRIFGGGGALPLFTELPSRKLSEKG